jgi:uncharacterized membrane protein YkvA (DUF1232 family)
MNIRKIETIIMKLNLQAVIDQGKQKARKLKAEVQALVLAYRHPQTPWYAKAFAGLVIAYSLSPIDLIPDFIPVLGYLDDLILVPLGITLAIRMIPVEVMAECRAQAEAEPWDGKPKNWLGAVIIAALWVVCIVWVVKLFRG